MTSNKKALSIHYKDRDDIPEIEEIVEAHNGYIVIETLLGISFITAHFEHQEDAFEVFKLFENNKLISHVSYQSRRT